MEKQIRIIGLISSLLIAWDENTETTPLDANLDSTYGTIR